MRQWWKLIHPFLLQNLQVLWRDVQQRCPALNDVCYLGCSHFAWLPCNSHKHAFLSPLLHFLLPGLGPLLYHCLLLLVSAALKQGQNTLLIGAGIWEGIFHYLQYHCLFPLFIYNLSQPCSIKVTWSRLFPISCGNFLILLNERCAYVRSCTSCLAVVGGVICTRYSGLVPEGDLWMLGHACLFIIAELPSRTGLYDVLYCTVVCEHQIMHGLVYYSWVTHAHLHRQARCQFGAYFLL